MKNQLYFPPWGIDCLTPENILANLLQPHILIYQDLFSIFYTSALMTFQELGEKHKTIAMGKRNGFVRSNNQVQVQMHVATH